MALLYSATLTPSKRELLASWLPGQPWLDGADVSSIEPIGSYRFDDPAGEVGVEVILVRSADGRVIQAPLSYRAAALEGHDHALVATMEHSVLGTRWCYDGCADPVFVRALATTILTGGHEAELEYEKDGRRTPREPTVRVVGSGGGSAPEVGQVSARPDVAATVITAGEWELVLRRVLDAVPETDGGATLTGTWPGCGEPVVLASARQSTGT